MGYGPNQTDDIISGRWLPLGLGGVMDIEVTYTITMLEAQAVALKKVLGSLTDDQFAAMNVFGKDRQSMRNLYGKLPFKPVGLDSSE